MSDTTDATRTEAERPELRTEIRDGFLRRRSGLVMPALLLVTGIALTWGTVTMEVPSTSLPPGPQVVPTIVAVACFVMAVVLAIDVLRKPESAFVAAPEDQRPEEAPTTTSVHLPGAGIEADDARPRSNRTALALAVGTTVIFIVAIVPVGWLLSAAFLFWGIARALGSRRPVFDLILALALSAIVQLAFSAGLGLSLPPGILAGVL